MNHAVRTIGVLALLLLAACGSKSAGEGSPDGGTGEATPPTPDAKFLPMATGPCPAMTPGTNTFSPDGNPRDVLLWVGDQAKTMDGPLVFVWHGAGGDPSEAPDILGPALDAIVAAGGIVAAPYHDPSNVVLPWYLSSGGDNLADVRVADEVLACAISTLGVDVRRIHSVGFSAGAMHNTEFAAYRSGYLASIVDYSGALEGDPTEQDPTNKYPAMLFYGGPDDQVIVDFGMAAMEYQAALKDEGHFSFICDHNEGHTVPVSGRPAAWQFLQDHPFKVSPEPYSTMLPAGFPSYCTLP